MEVGSPDFLVNFSPSGKGVAQLEPHTSKAPNELSDGSSEHVEHRNMENDHSSSKTLGQPEMHGVTSLNHDFRPLSARPAASMQVGLGQGNHMNQFFTDSKARMLEEAVESCQLPIAAGLSGPHAHNLASLDPRQEATSSYWTWHLEFDFLDSFEEGLAIFDLEGKLIQANRSWTLVHPGAKRGQSLLQIMPVHEALREMAIHARLLQGPPTPESLSHQVKGKDGSVRQWTTTRSVLRDGEGTALALLVRSRDVTEQYRLEEDSRFANMVLDQSLDAIVVTSPSFQVLNANPAFLNLTGFKIGSLIAHSVQSLRPQGELRAEGWRNMARELSEEGHWRGELAIRCADGLQAVLWCSANRLQNEDGKVLGYLLVLSDLSQILKFQAENNRLAQYDTLTRLPNRRTITEHAENCLLRARRDSTHCAFIYLDLNHFKSVNDSLGHAAGDLLLKVIAERLVLTAGPANMVARIGGDEFLLLLPGEGIRGAQALARSLLLEIGRPVDLDGLPSYRPRASLGLASFPEHGVTSDELMRSADMAMYAAKAKHIPFAAFDVGMRHEATQILEMRNALTGAVGRGEFQLFYQPIFQLSDGCVVGAEALLRWQNPRRGLLAPGQFLHLAEMAGLLRDIDSWVLQRAASDVAVWREAGLFTPNCWVSVNQTVEDLVRPEWDASIAEAARLAGVGGLHIELTEGHVSCSLEVLQRELRALEGLGVKLAVDDFGTGFSNLSYLCSLPIATVKIDRSFVQDVETKTQAQTLVRVMIGLAREFGYSVVAEGIETIAQLTFLREAGCDMGQGFYLSRPLEKIDFERLLKGRTRCN